MSLQHALFQHSLHLQGLLLLLEKNFRKKKKCLFSKFPGDPVVKNLPCNAEDTGLIPDKGTKPACHMPKPRSCVPQLRPTAAK